MNQTRLRTLLASAAAVVAGNFVYALTVKLFLLPSQLVVGGTNGIALIAEHFWNISTTGFIFGFNIAMLLLGLAVLGKAFALTTVASSFLYPLFLELLNKLLGSPTLTDDLLLNTVFSGLGIGISLGLVIRAGASTGGMDIPPLVLHKLFRVPVSVGLNLFDIGILLPQMFFRPTENTLYGILMLFIYSTVIDKMLMVGRSRTELKIVSDHAEEICDAILHKVDRGVTLLHSAGGYTHTERELVLSVISNRELFKAEKLIRSIDPECFMIVTRVSEVRGKGFSISRTGE